MAPRILIVEDEEPLLDLLRYNFEKSGYDVETLAHGDQAEARLKEKVPDFKPEMPPRPAVVAIRKKGGGKIA